MQCYPSNCYALFLSIPTHFVHFLLYQPQKTNLQLKKPLFYLTSLIPKSNYLNLKSSISRTRTTSPEKPLSVLNFFKQIGFTQTQIHSIIRQRTQILFSDVHKTLKHKIEFFQQLGFQGSQLGLFLSKNPTILAASLSKTLVPSHLWKLLRKL